MTLIDLITAPPADAHGCPTGQGDWRFAVEALVSPNNSRLGYVKLPFKLGGGLAWADLTGDAQGFSYNRGNPDATGGFPRPNVGAATLDLDNSDGRYSAWGADPSRREWSPQLSLIRVSFFRPGVSSTNLVGTKTWTNWRPVFTGRGKRWVELMDLGRDVMRVELVDTFATLNSIVQRAVTPVGGGESQDDRVARLLAASSFNFGSTKGYSAGSPAPLVATDLSTNRLAELQITAESGGNMVIADVDGQVKALDPWEQIPEPADIAGGPIFRLSSHDTDPVGDTPTGGYTAEGFYSYEGFEITSDDAWVINDATIVNTLGDTSVTSDTASQDRYGIQSYKRTDLICASITYTESMADKVITYSATREILAPDFSSLTSDLEQTMRPGKMLIADQIELQTKLDVCDRVVVEFYGKAVDPSDWPLARWLARVTSISGSIVVHANHAGAWVDWTTTYTTVSTVVYRPAEP